MKLSGRASPASSGTIDEVTRAAEMKVRVAWARKERTRVLRFKEEKWVVKRLKT